MKLTSASIIIAAAIGLHINGIAGASIVNRHVKSMTATHLFPGAHYGIEVDASEKSWGEIATTRKDRSFGSAWLGDTLLREMREFAGVDSPDPDFSSGDVLHEIGMTHIVETSPLHTDGVVGDQVMVSAGSSQGFYVLNDNPHAYFEMNDDELCIPILKGNFITFKGHRPHRTVIDDGSVDLLGPFDLHSLKCVRPCYCSTGVVTGTQDDGSGRQLGEETETVKTISGNVFRGTKYDDNMNEITEHYMTYNVTGLPRCSNCNMSLAFSNAQECTKETNDKAAMIPLLSNLTYSTDDDGNTGVKQNAFIVDSEYPAGNQFLSYTQNMHEGLPQVQESNESVFFYNTEGELVACSFLQPILSDEDKALAEELAAEMLAIISADMDENMADSISPEIVEDEATPIGDGRNSAGSLIFMFSFLPIVVSAAACVFFS